MNNFFSLNISWRFPSSKGKYFLIQKNICVESTEEKRTSVIQEMIRNLNSWQAQPIWAFLVAQTVKNPPAMQETWVLSLDQKKKTPGEGNGNPLQYSCMENPLDRGAWQATVYSIAKNWTWLSNWTTSTVKEMLDSEYFLFATLNLIIDYPYVMDI